jgi:hypothetical protein
MKTNVITVVLEKEQSDESAALILAAIRQIKGVTSAEANISDETQYLAITRARTEIRQQIVEILYPKNQPK